MTKRPVVKGPSLFEQAAHDWIAIRDLQVHPSIQRKFGLPHAKSIAAELDPEKFGEIAVNREGGRLLVFDGQHRLWAARSLWGDDEKVPCLIYDNLPVERLADVCLGRNQSKAWTAIDRWRMHLVAKHEPYCQAEGVLASHKMRTENSRTPGAVRAVDAVYHVVTKCGGPATLNRVVGILHGAWGVDPDAYDGTFLRGLGMLAHRFDGQIVDAELTKKLAKSGGPGRMLGQARDYSKAAGMSVTRAMAERILSIYQKGRRNGSGLSLGK